MIEEARHIVDDVIAMSTPLLAALAPQAVEGTKVALNRLLAMASTAVLPLSLALEEAAMAHPDFRAALEALDR